MFQWVGPMPFTDYGITAVIVGATGIYRLVKGTVEIYVGRGDIRDRLQAHLNGDNDCIALHAPTHFYFMYTSDDEKLEKVAILLYRPLCNQRLG